MKPENPPAKKLSVDELIRLALICAEQDRQSLAEAWPAKSPERAKALSQFQQLKAYRLKRFGKTGFEKMISEAKNIDVLSERSKEK